MILHQNKDRYNVCNIVNIYIHIFQVYFVERKKIIVLRRAAGRRAGTSLLHYSSVECCVMNIGISISIELLHIPYMNEYLYNDQYRYILCFEGFNKKRLNVWVGSGKLYVICHVKVYDLHSKHFHTYRHVQANIHIHIIYIHTFFLYLFPMWVWFIIYELSYFWIFVDFFFYASK